MFSLIDNIHTVNTWYVMISNKKLTDLFYNKQLRKITFWLADRYFLFYSLFIFFLCYDALLN
jgi:hypothetical protein